MLGAMVVAGQEGFIKSEYKKFNAKFEDTKKGDDYCMLKETLKRRFLNEKMKVIKPDLIIIDGGKGQYNAALKVLNELEVKVPFICMAKGKDRNAGKEWIFYEGTEFQLPFTSPLLYYLQVLRDEAHRFAIASHRNRRDRNLTGKLKSPLCNTATQ
jgi:excinuclease ABC subunit C